MAEKIIVETAIRQVVEVEIQIEQVIAAINYMPLARRWNHLATMLNEIDLHETELEPRQKEVIIAWLKKKLVNFNEL